MDGLFLENLILRSTLLIAQAQQSQISAGADASDTGEDWGTYAYGIMFVVGIFVLPFVLSHFITKAIRMPTHSFRLGIVFAAIAGGLLFAYGNDFRLNLGADMRGGTNLVYDIVEDELGETVDPNALASALSQRINPSGTKEITIRPRGSSQIEITVPMVDELELQQTKELLQNSGLLQFRIVANGRDHEAIIAAARQQASNPDESIRLSTEVTDSGGDVIGMWFMIGRSDQETDGVYPLRVLNNRDLLRNRDTGEILNIPPLPDEQYALEKWLQDQGISGVEMLMALEKAGNPYALVMGDDLASAAVEYDKFGQPVVSFRLTTAGASKMLQLTSRNQPDGNFKRRMAIIMDDKVLSAPNLNEPIGSNGQISGRFTQKEVEFLVTILRSGRLPATLSDEPASEERVGAGLGATTVQKGLTASLWAIIATFVCILVYYRFAGIIASLALIINGLLIFGVMIFIGQPLTLPGLAGLVLTVGMSVDANVLIFERIREEKNKGSTPRMAIRNGFDRAFTTIIDSNLTTLIAAIVLYWIGTDQVRGFAVALIIGIGTSMFTATFCSRVMFEIAEKLKFVSLSMADGVGLIKSTLFGDENLNFMSWQKVCFGVSVVLIVLGVSAVGVRRSDVLNIDFMGGTSVTFQLQDPVDAETLREITQQILDEDEEGKPVQSTLVRVEKDPPDTVYSLVTSIDDIDLLSEKLLAGFAESQKADLVTYRIRVIGGSDTEQSMNLGQGGLDTRFVAYQQEGETENEQASGDTGQPSSETGPGDNEGQAADENGSEESGDLAAGTPETKTEIVLEFGSSIDDREGIAESDRGTKIDGETLKTKLLDAAKQEGFELAEAQVAIYPADEDVKWREGDVEGFARWRVRLPLSEQETAAVVSQLEQDIQRQPKWLSLSKIGTRVAGEMQQRAIAAILLSLVFIVAYIWFRFQKLAYGLAAVVALVHDVTITLGVLALCHWLARPLSFLLIEDFKIGLTEVAAFLTIIGYSLNDTIVVFDRIREVRGRSPRLTMGMINESVNQTLSRTLLTSGTTLLAVILLYVFGGEGIHAFSFALLIGILIGTYSSIFVAAPVLLWFSNREAGNTAQQRSANA